MAKRAFIELGSNVEPEQHLPQAAAALASVGRVVGVSEVYRTEPYGPEGQPPFLNAVIELQTDLEPRALRRALREIESELGRERADDPYTPRTIDLDLCLYNQLVLETPDLRLPDPHLGERAYLARSMADLAPELTHPVTGETMGELAARLEPAGSYQSRPAVRRKVLAALKAVES